MARESSSIVDAMETQGRIPGFEWQRDWEAQQSYPKMGTDGGSQMPPGKARNQAQRCIFGELPKFKSKYVCVTYSKVLTGNK